MTRKGIILAGGSGTRLYPVTQVVSKQLLPVYDKPMIYYPLSTLMLAGHPRDPAHLHARGHAALRAAARRRQRSGALNLAYAVQPSPDGLAQAFVIGREFVGGDPSALVLGDNIFYGHDLVAAAGARAARARTGATVFAYPVADPERYGVVEFDAHRTRDLARGEADAAEVALRRHRPLLLRQPRARHRRDAEAVGARRARDHRRQPRVSRCGRRSRAR